MNTLKRLSRWRDSSTTTLTAHKPDEGPPASPDSPAAATFPNTRRSVPGGFPGQDISPTSDSSDEFPPTHFPGLKSPSENRYQSSVEDGYSTRAFPPPVPPHSSSLGDDDLHDEGPRREGEHQLKEIRTANAHRSPGQPLKAASMEFKTKEQEKEEEKLEKTAAAKARLIMGPIERFRVDFSHPTDPAKSYWDGFTGPVSREDFNEYCENHGKITQRIKIMAIEAADKVWGLQRDLNNERRHRMEQAKNIPPTSSKGLPKSLPGQRGALKPPAYREKGTSVPDEEMRSFLYGDFEDRIDEMIIKVKLLRSQTALLRTDWKEAYMLASDAHKIAKEFNYPPLEGKCLYWRGVAADRHGSHRNAHEFFRQAQSCIGVYAEGKYVKDAIIETGFLVDEMRKEAKSRPGSMIKKRRNATLNRISVNTTF
ncbi:MAG: hypothetical protein M1827_002402 [Pycnora praestabilis]|nr:MAG: hypothetical protein M1827_002402 [Pycnora praestabilis]